VAMDGKLASDVRRAADRLDRLAPDLHGTHRRFLEVARRAPEVVVKVVITPASEDAEIDALVERVAAVDPAVPLVLQPVTPFARVREAPPAQRLLALQDRASKRLEHVRIIPQTHKQIGVL